MENLPDLCRFLRRVLPLRQPPHLWRGHCCYLDHRIVDGEPLIQLYSRVTVDGFLGHKHNNPTDAQATDLSHVFSTPKASLELTRKTTLIRSEIRSSVWGQRSTPACNLLVCCLQRGKWECLNSICLTSFVFNMREDALVAVTVPSMRIISTLSPSMLPTRGTFTS